MRPLLAAAVVALLPAIAHAQLEVAAPVTPAGRSQFLVSVRFAVGASIALGLQSGSSFAYGLTVGGRVLVPSGSDRAWLIGSDLGVDRTAGFVDHGATHVVLGLTAAHSWGTLGLAWAPAPSSPSPIQARSPSASAMVSASCSSRASSTSSSPTSTCRAPPS